MKKIKEPDMKMPPYDPDIIEKDLCTLFSPEWLEYAARETGLIKRERKVTAVEMFWVLVNSYGVRLARNLAFIKRNYEKASNEAPHSRAAGYLMFPHLLLLFQMADLSLFPNNYS